MKPRLSFVLSSLHISGGVRVIIECANRLAERGYPVNLVTPKNSLSANIQTELNPHVTIYQSSANLRWPPTSLWTKIWLAWSLAKAIPPSDIIISTHAPTTISTFLARHLWQRKTKLCWFYQDHPAMFNERRLENWLLHHAASWHHHILVTTDWLKQEAYSFLGTNITTIGIGLSQAHLLQPHPKAVAPFTFDNPATILCLGDDRPRKGLYDFLAALEQLDVHKFPLKIIVVSARHFTLKTVRPIQIYYQLSTAELAQLYATCDLFVSASWLESFGLPPLEAMACGAPVILTDSGGVKAFAKSGENCLMIPPQNPHYLAEAMKQILTNPQLAQRLRQNGPPTAAQFNWNTVVDRFEKAIAIFYNEIK